MNPLTKLSNTEKKVPRIIIEVFAFFLLYRLPFFPQKKISHLRKEMFDIYYPHFGLPFSQKNKFTLNIWWL